MTQPMLPGAQPDFDELVPPVEGSSGVTATLVPIPLTGEALDLTAPDDQLAEAFDRIRDLERQLKEARDVISEELLHRFDARAKWTVQVGGYEVRAPSPEAKDEWDVDALRATLANLVAEGSISEDAADAAVEPIVEWKVRARGISALRKLGGDVVDQIDGCCTKVPPVRRLSVKRVRD